MVTLPMMGEPIIDVCRTVHKTWPLKIMYETDIFASSQRFQGGFFFVFLFLGKLVKLRRIHKFDFSC